MAIPLSVLIAFALMPVLDIDLEMVSIAAFIVSLGMLVDDPVVASDGINREMANGQPRTVAAWLGPVKLRRAIFYSTAINVAAFLPLILLPGDTGAFMEALPIVVTLTPVMSWMRR